VSSPPIFESIGQGPTLAAQVSDQVEEMILTGRLRDGDLLPPERELSRQFGVSRTVVREALSRLVAKELIEVSSAGTTVRRPSLGAASLSLRHLLRPALGQHDKILEVRRLLEIEIAGLAAARRGADDVARLAANLAETEACKRDAERFALCDNDFHMSLAAATQNELFTVLLGSLAGVLVAMRRLGYHTPGNPDRALRHHHAIFEQVRAGSADGARAAMRDHLIEAEQTIRLAIGLTGQPAGQPEND
jgi:GntR family transcriptional repressor for pyruvate dehydrogenase complex